MNQLKLLEMPRIEFIGNLLRPPCLEYAVPVRFPEIHKAKQLVIDLETYDPDLTKLGSGVRRDGHIVGIGINADNEYSEYYPIRHIYGPNCNPEKVLSWLRDQLKVFRGEIVGANLMYDGDFLQVSGIKADLATFADIQYAEPLLNESADSYGLDALARKYLGEGKRESEVTKLYGPDWKKAIREVHPGHLREYVLGDVTQPLEILKKQRVELGKQGLLELFRLECRLIPLLLYMRDKGVKVDLEKANELNIQFTEKIKVLSADMEKIVGFPVNYRPSGSLIEALNSLKIAYPTTEKGNPSITTDWLNKVNHPFCTLAAEAREYDKIQGTFIQGYILDNNIKGRIHAEFHPLRRADEEGHRGTVSGRFSSTNPNLQNIPVRTELGRLIRELFIPETGQNFWSRDYSQIEYRLLVHMAVVTGCKGAEIAQKMYIENPNTDFHLLVSELTGLDRKPAKNLNFGLIYGMGKAKLARTLGVDDIAASEIMEIYHSRAPFIKELFGKAMNIAQDRGYVKTLLGRRARFNEMEPKYYGEGEQRARTHKALNCVLQGSAADMMKTCLVNIFESGILKSGDISLNLTVHDELDGSVSLGESGKKALDSITKMMENALRLEVPIRCEGSEGKNWAEAH